LLLSQSNALPDAAGLRRYLRAVLLQGDAVSDTARLQRHLRAVLPQADALPVLADRAARELCNAFLLRSGLLSKIALPLN
jgi:hypothetical protein